MFYISTLENTRALALGELKAILSTAAFLAQYWYKEKHAVRL
jgi:hypothetical protein